MVIEFKDDMSLQPQLRSRRRRRTVTSSHQERLSTLYVSTVREIRAKNDEKVQLFLHLRKIGIIHDSVT